MSMTTTDHVVVITGGSSGIGLCTAKLFAARGWRVGLIARGREGLDAARQEVAASGATVAVAAADVSDVDAIEAAAASLERELGAIDVWINDAGISFYSRFVEMTPDEFQHVVDVTFFGVVNGTRTALKRMAPRGDGAIVNVGSLAGFRGAPLQSPYAASKFALRGFTEALRSELIHDGVGVHLGMVHPPSVNTPFFAHAGSRLEDAPRPLPPVYQPEIIAEAIWICAIERRREIKVTGTTTSLAWLNRLLPGISDRVAAWSGFATQHTSDEEVQRLRDPAFTRTGKQRYGVHGPFGREAFESSRQSWATQHRLLLGAGALLLALVTRPRVRPRAAVRPQRAAAPKRPALPQRRAIPVHR